MQTLKYFFLQIAFCLLFSNYALCKTKSINLVTNYRHSFFTEIAGTTIPFSINYQKSIFCTNNINLGIRVGSPVFDFIIPWFLTESDNYNPQLYPYQYSGFLSLDYGFRFLSINLSPGLILSTFRNKISRQTFLWESTQIVIPALSFGIKYYLPIGQNPQKTFCPFVKILTTSFFRPSSEFLILDGNLFGIATGLEF